jgi:hypothetical protein
MDFCGALKELLEGERMRREEWDDDGTYLEMKDGKLCIYKPDTKQFHPLIVSTGDMTADDWETC